MLTWRHFEQTASILPIRRCEMSLKCFGLLRRIVEEARGVVATARVPRDRIQGRGVDPTYSNIGPTKEETCHRDHELQKQTFRDL